MRSNSYCLFGGKECGNVGSPNSKRFHKVLRLTRDALGPGAGSAAQKQNFQTCSSVTEEWGGLTWKSLRNGEPKHGLQKGLCSSRIGGCWAVLQRAQPQRPSSCQAFCSRIKYCAGYPVIWNSCFK